MATAGDQAAILRVIENETAAYFNKDYEGWAACWVHAPYVRRFGWFAQGGRLISQSWEQEAAEKKEAMQQYPAPNRSVQSVVRENLNIRVGGKVAWVTFEQIAPETGDPFDVQGRQYEGRVMEKHGGEWKIACCFQIGSPIEFVASPLLRVDERSDIVWMNKAASEQIGQHRGLTVVNGQLRARGRAANQRLQSSVRWAAGVRGYAASQAARYIAPARRGCVPVVLSDGEADIADVCWVIAESGMTLVAFNDSRMTEA
jgi:hypothetical protein